MITSPGRYHCFMGIAGPIFLLVLAQQQDERLLRLAEEAELFAQNASKMISEETLRQKAIKAERRFYPRIGQAALEGAPLKYVERELKSEFGYALIGEGEQAVFHEARQVLSVDGKAKQNADKARRRLIAGLKSADDDVKKQLLEDLEKNGLAGSATDFTLMMLLFRQRSLVHYNLQAILQKNIGADRVIVYSFKQKEGPEAFTIFQGKQTIHQKLEGEVWLRASDGLPLKIIFNSAIPGPNGQPLVDRGEVDYVRAANGVLAPVSALHRRTSGPTLVGENHFSYSGFKKFSADSEIKFSPAEEPPAAAPAKP